MFNVPMMPSARWVRAEFCGTWITAWLQNETVEGYWIQVDPDSPFRCVSRVVEL